MSRRSPRRQVSGSNLEQSPAPSPAPSSQIALSAAESMAMQRQKAIQQMITSIQEKVAFQQQQFWRQADYQSKKKGNRSQKRLATLIKWRKAQRGLEDPVKLKQFIPSQQSPAPKWSKNAVKKGSRRSKINNNDAVAKAASALVKSGVQTEIQRSTEESDPYNALLTHGILNELRQDPQSLSSLTNSVEAMLVKMNEATSTINDLLPKVETWATVFSAIGLLKYSDLRDTGKKPLGVTPMVSELARIGADDVIEDLNNTEACDKACAWIWNTCDEWKLPWEALNLADQGQLKVVEEKFGPEILQRVYKHIWSRDELRPHKQPVLQLLATHGLHGSIRKHFGVRVEADACAWVWQRSRSWGQLTEDGHGQKGLRDVRLLDLDKSQDRMLANVDEHVQEIIKLRKERRKMMAEEESLLRRAMYICRRNKGRSSLVDVPRIRPDGPLARRRELPLGVDPKGMLGSMVHYGRKRRMYSPRVSHSPLSKKPKLVQPFEVPLVIPCMVDGRNTVSSFIRTQNIPWSTVYENFQPVMTNQQTPRSARDFAVDIPKFKEVDPSVAADGYESSGSEDTSDERFTQMHKATLESLKTRLDKLWQALDHKRQQALERRRQGVEKRKMQRKNNRKRSLLLTNAQKLQKKQPSGGTATKQQQTAAASPASTTPTTAGMKRSKPLHVEVSDSVLQPTNKKARINSNGHVQQNDSPRRAAKKATTPKKSTRVTPQKARPDPKDKKSTPKSHKKQVHAISSRSPRSPRPPISPRGNPNARRTRSRTTPRDSRATARSARLNPVI